LFFLLGYFYSIPQSITTATGLDGERSQLADALSFDPTQRAPFLKFPNQLQHQQIPESIIPQSITTPANSRINYNN